MASVFADLLDEGKKPPAARGEEAIEEVRAKACLGLGSGGPRGRTLRWARGAGYASRVGTASTRLRNRVPPCSAWVGANAADGLLRLAPKREARPWATPRSPAIHRSVGHAPSSLKLQPRRPAEMAPLALPSQQEAIEQRPSASADLGPRSKTGRCVARLPTDWTGPGDESMREVGIHPRRLRDPEPIHNREAQTIRPSARSCPWRGRAQRRPT